MAPDETAGHQRQLLGGDTQCSPEGAGQTLRATRSTTLYCAYAGMLMDANDTKAFQDKLGPRFGQNPDVWPGLRPVMFIGEATKERLHLIPPRSATGCKNPYKGRAG